MMNSIGTLGRPDTGEADTKVFARDDGIVRRAGRRRESDRMKTPSTRTADGQVTPLRNQGGQRATINPRDC
jgi:hypothetical protein